MSRVENLMGRTSGEVITHIAETHPKIATFTLGHYQNMPGGSSGRHLGMQHWEEVRRAKLLVPGWVDAAERLLPKRDETLAICSPVKLKDGTGKHILMLDVDSLEPDYNSKTSEFEKRSQDEVLKAAKELARSLREVNFPPGCILFSGHGLHFIGLHLVEEADFEPLAWQVVGMHHDADWASYASNYGFYALRLNIGKHKIMVPKVVMLFNPNYGRERYKEHLDYESVSQTPVYQDESMERWMRERTENPIFTSLPEREETTL